MCIYPCQGCYFPRRIFVLNSLSSCLIFAFHICVCWEILLPSDQQSPLSWTLIITWHLNMIWLWAASFLLEISILASHFGLLIRYIISYGINISFLASTILIPGKRLSMRDVNKFLNSPWRYSVTDQPFRGLESCWSGFPDPDDFDGSVQKCPKAFDPDFSVQVLTDENHQLSGFSKSKTTVPLISPTYRHRELFPILKGEFFQDNITYRTPGIINNTS